MNGPLKYSSFETIEDSVSCLRGTFVTGRPRELYWRKFHVQRLYDLVKQNEERFYEALAKDMNKPRMEAFVGDISPVLEECIYYLDNLDRLIKDRKVKSRSRISNAGGINIIRKDPLGVVLIIGAWNFPVQLTLVPLVAALAAGNTVILKPSEISAHTSALLTELFPLYLDSSICRIVNGGATETTFLLTHSFDYIFYTGSTRVGKIVMEAATKHLTPITLELGGKCPAFVTEDVNIETVAQRIAFGKFYNGGQACVAADYVLIHESKLAGFIDAFAKTIKKWFGENPRHSSHFARMVTVNHFDHVARLLNERQSGDIVIGGDMHRDERYIGPTLVTNIAYSESVLMGDEIFGPVLPVLTYKEIDDAISYVNKKESPLALYIFSKNKKVTEKILSTTRSGGVLVNDTLVHQAEYSLPFGGIGNSGMGSYHGEKSFDTFTHERSILIKNQRMESLMRLRYPPYTSKNFRILRSLLSTHPWVYYYKTHRTGVKVNLLLAFLLILFLRQRY
ncbi:Aldehyde/histidinol dehydrogenase [Halteromyces radiatus]|uniref:Aldehyde/histidinol dehydrogenase n=1 Tax=Halteromyces radiatus TaxID=101107 RepID=UPI0022211E9F|nr:Aldehyde/histidinol dehydrogenase [Halteromyces radiatus]KAI8092472.1 Aldehyde/histidinol dehydrogenase [Halteromyces radiatus]